jgi:CRISP-associated protein Cas1
VIKRTIEISRQSHLSLRNKQLIVNQGGDVVGQIPVEDIGELILNDPRITMTQAVMVESQKNNVALILCDEKHLPISTLLPISEGNKLHSKVLRSQIDIRASTKKRLWQNIVMEKIANQAETLKLFNKDYKHIQSLVKRVKSGDPTNIEATAARYYWLQLFGEQFRRRQTESGINALLNYGYSILRASVARAIVGTGLHPALGLNHHNQYNGLSLADDLMEPFRPWIDRRVKKISLDTKNATDINKESKKELLGMLEEKVVYKGEHRAFMMCLGLVAANLKNAIINNEKSLQWPSLD